MQRTAQEFQDSAIKNNLSRYNIHDCSICGYRCGYEFRGEQKEQVGYDSGCDCSYGGGYIDLRSWAEIAEHYNRNQPERNKDIKPEWVEEQDKFWGFTLTTNT